MESITISFYNFYVHFQLYINCFVLFLIYRYVYVANPLFTSVSIFEREEDNHLNIVQVSISHTRHVSEMNIRHTYHGQAYISAPHIHIGHNHSHWSILAIQVNISHTGQYQPYYLMSTIIGEYQS